MAEALKRLYWAWVQAPLPAPHASPGLCFQGAHADLTNDLPQVLPGEAHLPAPHSFKCKAKSSTSLQNRDGTRTKIGSNPNRAVTRSNFVAPCMTLREADLREAGLSRSLRDSPMSCDPVSGDNHWAKGQGWGSIVQHHSPRLWSLLSRRPCPSRLALALASRIPCRVFNEPLSGVGQRARTCEGVARSMEQASCHTASLSEDNGNSSTWSQGAWGSNTTIRWDDSENRSVKLSQIRKMLFPQRTFS